MSKKEEDKDNFYLECTENTHNKFYKMEIERTNDGRFIVHLRWGRIGGTGFESSKIFKSEKQGRAFIKTTLLSKKGKGYKLVEDKKDKRNIDEIPDLTKKTMDRFARFAQEW